MISKPANANSLENLLKANKLSDVTKEIAPKRIRRLAFGFHPFIRDNRDDKPENTLRNVCYSRTNTRNGINKRHMILFDHYAIRFFGKYQHQEYWHCNKQYLTVSFHLTNHTKE